MEKAFAAIAGVILLVVGLSFLISWPVMALWNNCLVGAVDGVHAIGWLQAWGVSILCGFLFKTHTSSK
jgi:hypothetical protein